VVRYGLAVGLELTGQLTAASQAYAEAEALARPRQNQHLVALAASRLAQVQVIQGQLRAAAATCERALRLAGGEPEPLSPLYGIAHGVLGQIYFEQGQPAAAEPHLAAGLRLAQTWANSEGLVPSLTGLARVRLAQGDTAGALAAADELAQRLRAYHAAPLVPVGDALRARLYAEAGRLGPAAEWAQTTELDTAAPWAPAQELEGLALVVVQLALGQTADAERLARRLAAEAEAGERWGRLAESLILAAVAAQANGRGAAAQADLRRALALAEPEGWVRLLVDRGEPARQLLTARTQSDEPASAALSAFVQRLLAAFGRDGELIPSAPAPAPISLAEPLTERELEVLRLIDGGLTNQAIAGRLVISLGTVKSHTANLFGKLGVNSRTQATAKARALGLLPADPTNPAR
jgi:LuxR family maltose regulon positive regulatory protein